MNVRKAVFFLFSFLFIQFTSWATPDSTQTDSIIISPDSEVLRALDQMARAPFLEANQCVTDTHKLNIHNFAADSIPWYDSAHFATRLNELDMQSPFDLVYNPRVDAFIKLYAVKRRKQTSRLLGLQHTYFPMMEELLDKHEMPMELKYLSVIESGLNPKARSHAGAVGLWQFMYSTGKMYGLHQNSYMDERMDPIKSTDAALRYLKYLYGIYHKWDLALAAYNCGPGNVNKAMRRSGTTTGNYWDIYPFLPRETRGYVPAFIAVNYVMNNAEAHNIYPVMPKAHYFELDTVHVKQPIGFDQIAKALEISVEDLEQYNPTYKLNYIPAYSNKTSLLYLPYDKAQLFVTNDSAIYALAKKEKPNTGNEVAKFQEDRIVYRVKSGDYLGKIANKYHVSVSSIKRWNGLRSNNLRVGQKLVIYPKGGVSPKQTAQKKKAIEIPKNAKYYQIQNGDTLWDIAEASGVSIEQIKRWNANLNERNLKVGTKIIVGDS